MPLFPTLLVAALLVLNIAAQGPRLEVGRDEAGLALRVRLSAPAVVDMEARTEVEASDDLQNWLPLAAYTNSNEAAESLPLRGDASKLFFRARQSQRLSPSRAPGAEIFGYQAEFQRNLQQIGFIAPGELTNVFQVPDYLPALTWDPTTADFWGEFQLDTSAHNSALPLDSSERRISDFRLNEAELAMFKRNGFVASRRFSNWSFGEAFYRVFMDDLPVYISSDAILQSWHQVFKLMLKEWEVHHIHPELDRLLESTATALGPLLQQHSGGPFEASVRDADVFLAVARSLLKGQPVPTQSGQDAEVARILEGVASEQYRESFELFGLPRPMDFSQFKPRGNYEDRPGYFRATMWLGRVDMRVADPQPGTIQSGSLRELARAIALHEALSQSGELRAWEGINTILETLIGYADSMNFLQLAALLNAGGLPTLQDIGTEANLVRLQNSILNGSLGYQQIRGDVFFTPLDGSQRKLPRSFAFSGQRFIFDSWALSQVVHDGILWPDSSGNLSKVRRLMPDTLDVAFAVLGNNAVAPMIVDRIQTGTTNTWRDGHPYQRNLAALRMVVDAQRSGVWTNSSVYNAWLGALRALSQPTTGPEHAEVFRTRAWANKQLQAQLAGWTQLRHDTMLYAKPSYTAPILCSYPHGYVEPLPEFWDRMRLLSERMAAAFAAVSVPTNFQTRLTNQLAHLAGFSQTTATLREIAAKELRREELSERESDFLKDVVEVHKTYNGKLYSGWYPKLFYRPHDQSPETFPTSYGCEKSDSLIADIHTKVPDEAGPGKVLHTAVGHPTTILIAVDQKVVYAGPIFTYFEFEQPGVERLSDSEWKVMEGSVAPPEWTREFLTY